MDLMGERNREMDRKTEKERKTEGNKEKKRERQRDRKRELERGREQRVRPTPYGQVLEQGPDRPDRETIAALGDS